eukprot:CAMPEP_0114636024 /NCGR_PEP_ID=MMETSP0168-20121206/16779_1 /TAXON_ID=95228 ORGANISM="Vannella sp., Strain DIVA3 517/6/12" /NCGR_SAMPLE_ID=MMETSP0168 /ASSEMBLY_ACC=CAM_ASM_000044 /LENGTH=136 /DNA_ID=CAMNT_0001847737 /DNA_START=58 /DNA_END=466 /DNA_ORIENTATION=-
MGADEQARRRARRVAAVECRRRVRAAGPWCGCIVHDELTVDVEALEEVCNELLRMRLEGAVNEQEERVCGGELELFPQEVDHDLEHGRGGELELAPLQRGRVARVLEEDHHLTVLHVVVAGFSDGAGEEAGAEARA